MPKIHDELIFRKKSGIKSFAVLIDPDKVNSVSLQNVVNLSNQNRVDFFFVGGSLINKDVIKEVVVFIKQHSNIPVILFPSNSSQIIEEADAILFLSLISGRNPDYLIGQQVISAPILARSSLEIMSTGYMLVDCGSQTTASYISNTTPLPYNKPEIAAATAMAGEMIGMKLIYADGGSGADTYISPKMISTIHKNTTLPLIVGGGLKSSDGAFQAWQSGADLIVVGNHIEHNPEFIAELCSQRDVFMEISSANLK